MGTHRVANTVDQVFDEDAYFEEDGESLSIDSRFDYFERYGVHYYFLKDRIPTWLTQAATPRLEELAYHNGAHRPAWYTAASLEKRGLLTGSHTAYRETLNALEATLASITEVMTFAEERLKSALKQTFNLDLNVRAVFFARKYVFPRNKPEGYGAFAFGQENDPAMSYRYRGVSLLEAALANFDSSEEEKQVCNDCQIVTTHDVYDGDVIPTFSELNKKSIAIAPEDFARMCRTLDLGALYQQHLKAVLRPELAVDRSALDQKLQAYQRQQLELSVELARLQFAAVPGSGVVKSGISDAAYQILKQVLAGALDAVQARLPVTFASLKVFDIQLIGPLLIGLSGGRSRAAERVLAYIPNDPQQPLKEYASHADFVVDFRKRLHSAAYRRFFSRFIPQREQGAFFKRFNQKYQPSGNKDATRDYPLDSQPAMLVVDTVAIAGNLLGKLSRAFVDKVFSDAKAVAVRTDDEDIEARERRLESYRDALGSFPGEAFLVLPRLGSIMLDVGAVQVCDELFDGIEEFNERDIKRMWQHISSAAIYGRGVGEWGHGSHWTWPNVFKPVTMPSGKRLLWKTNLRVYESPVIPPVGSKADELGLYQHKGKTIVSIEGKYYQVRQDADTGQYRILHPTRPQAYAPKLAHNYQGAWRHELEEPLNWDEPKLLRRLGLTQSRELLRVCGIEPDVLRETVVNEEPLPLVLGEMTKRFEIHQQLTAFVEQMNSDDLLVYAKADPGLQLDIMQRRGLLPATPLLRVLGSRAEVLWESSGPPALPRRVVALSSDHLSRGELLKEVLSTLQGVDPSLAQIPGNLQDSLSRRADLLRKFIAGTVDALKGAMIDERYRALTRTDNPDVQRVLEGYPNLSTLMATHVLESLDSNELKEFRRQGQLPEAVAVQMHWCEREARVCRAYEGLHLGTMANLDSQRLLLRTLETLPGWAPGTRVVLRQNSSQGPILDAIGATDVTPVKTLVVQKSSTQVPSDFYTDVWAVLAPAEHRALGWTDAQQLRQAIRNAPLPRDKLRRVLLEISMVGQPRTVVARYSRDGQMHDIFSEPDTSKPPYAPLIRLFYGAGGFPRMLEKTPSALRSPEARERKLYPSFAESSVSWSYSDNVMESLARREAEFENLERELSVWVQQNTSRSGGTAFDRAGGRLACIANEIKRCWRKEAFSSELRLVNGGGIPLPAFSGNFVNVRVLEIAGFKDEGGASATLKHFTGLRYLTLRQCELTSFPPPIGKMRQLRSLDLESNPLQLTAQDVETLETLNDLQSLNLKGCPLDAKLDFSHLQHLTELNLSITQMDP